MTRFCAAFGALPLMLASGAGAGSRQAIGVAISAILTLGVVPGASTLAAHAIRVLRKKSQ